MPLRKTPFLWLLEKEWREQIDEAQRSYVRLVEHLMERYGWVADKVHRRKMAREAARGVLPNSTETKIVVTANARAWRTMLELRSSEGAELEIRRCAVAMLKLLSKEIPAGYVAFDLLAEGDDDLRTVPFRERRPARRLFSRRQCRHRQ